LGFLRLFFLLISRTGPDAINRLVTVCDALGSYFKKADRDRDRKAAAAGLNKAFKRAMRDFMTKDQYEDAGELLKGLGPAHPRSVHEAGGQGQVPPAHLHARGRLRLLHPAQGGRRSRFPGAPLPALCAPLPPPRGLPAGPDGQDGALVAL